MTTTPIITPIQAERQTLTECGCCGGLHVFAANPAYVAELEAQNAALMAERDALKAAKWDVKHVDTMNDMALMGMARDAALAERDRANAARQEAAGTIEELLDALKTASWLLADISPDGLVKIKVDAAIALASAPIMEAAGDA